MKHWIIYGIVAALAYGISAIPLKYASSQKYLSGSVSLIIVGTGIGAVAVLLIYALKEGMLGGAGQTQFSMPALSFGFISGVFGVVGLIALLTALKSPTTDVSRLMAIVSTSVLVTAVLGMVVFKEIPSGIDRIKVIIGIILIISGLRLVVR